MSRYAIGAMFILALLVPLIDAQSDQGCSGLLCPTVYRSRFKPNPGAALDSGSRDGWESYPITQETGYEPTIFPVTEAGASRLVRAAQPTQDGPFLLGFIRRINLVTGNHGSFHAQLRAPLAVGRQKATLLLFRGENEERHQMTLPDAQWHAVDVPLAQSGKTVTAVALILDAPEAHVGREQRFEMRDVSIHALAVRHLEVRSPEVLWDAARELYYARQTMRVGETLQVALRSDAGPREPALQWSLSSADGRIVRHGEGTTIRHTFTATDPPGIWRLHAQGEYSSTDLLVLVRPVRPIGLVFDAPRHLSAELLAAVRARRDELRAKAKPETGANISVMDPQWLLAGLPSYFKILLESPELAELDAIDYRESGDVASLAEARNLLRHIAAWPSWVHPWFPAHGYHSYYPVGLMTRSVVMAMEFLGADLEPAERTALEHALLQQAIRPIYEEYVLEDRLQFNTSNWIGNTVGGALLAALESSDPAVGGYALGLAMKERDHVRAAYTRDGSYGEGVTYHRFDLETTAPAAAAMKRQLGLSLDEDLLRSASDYLVHAAYGNSGALLDYGDSHVDVGPSNVFAYVASLNRSASLSQFYFRYRDPGTAELLPRVLWEALIARPVEAVPPDSPSKVFSERGIAVLRDDWSADANVIAMRAGPNFNHNHADEGSLFYARNGLLWLGEAGYADYYKDPSYNTYNIQAMGHNVLLIDDDPESQSFPGNLVFGKAPALEHFMLSPTAALVQADLTSVYRGKLEHYTRTLFWTSDGTVAVLDDVRAAKPHRYTQVWHPVQPISGVDAQGFVLARGSDTLRIRAVSNVGVRVTQTAAPLPLVSYERAETESIERPQLFTFSTKDMVSAATLASVFTPGPAIDALALTTKDHATTLVFSGHRLALRRADGDAVVAQVNGTVIALKVRQLGEGLLGGSLEADSPIDLVAAQTSASALKVAVHGKPGATLRFVGLLPACTRGCTVRDGGVLMDGEDASVGLVAQSTHNDPKSPGAR